MKMVTSKKILIIDDDKDWCELLRHKLAKSGFKVQMTHDGVSGLRKAYEFEPELILLDIMMPQMDGWQACQRFRELTQAPIILLTALNSSHDKIKAFDLGADDYLVKPFHWEELMARIQATLRRASGSITAIKRDYVQSKPILTQDSLVINQDRYEVTLDGQRINLTPIEFRLLSTLAKHKGRVLPHSYLLTEVWGSEYLSELNSLRLYISYLRRKIEKDPENPRFIHSEWGVGYRFG
jgi:two-component system KDP operon response regulator KdpE